MLHEVTSVQEPLSLAGQSSVNTLPHAVIRPVSVSVSPLGLSEFEARITCSLPDQGLREALGAGDSESAAIAHALENLLLDSGKPCSFELKNLRITHGQKCLCEARVQCVSDGYAFHGRGKSKDSKRAVLNMLCGVINSWQRGIRKRRWG